MKELKAKEGYYLSDKDKTTFFTSIKGENINEQDYIDVEISEAEAIMKHNEAVKEIDTLEKIDNYSYKASIIPEVINHIPMTNNEALARKSMFPEWKEGIDVNKGEKYNCDDYLWEALTTHKMQANWRPSLATASIWKHIDEEHEGTEDDPIPYAPPMELFNGKYYIQDEIKYKCTRDSQIPLSHNLSELVGLYVELV